MSEKNWSAGRDLFLNEQNQMHTLSFNMLHHIGFVLLKGERSKTTDISCIL